MRSKNRKRAAAVGLACIFLLTTAAVTVYVVKNSGGRPAEENMQAQPAASQAETDIILYDGHKYRYNYDLENILFLGIDKKEEVTIKDTPGVAGQSDCVMVLSMDKVNKTAKILQISRDAMTDIDIYDANGNYYTTVTAQLATQYAYGNGGKSSCWASKKTVSELLFGLPLDGYISLNMDAISALNDGVGGVTLTIPEDYTNIDAAFVKGSQVTLDGAQAEHYVRYRDTAVRGSNSGRMERQVQYISALITALKAKAGGMRNYYNMFESLLEPYLVTDLSAEQMNDLANYRFIQEETRYVPGEARAGEEHEEFYVNDENLQQLLIEMFYKLQE